VTDSANVALVRSIVAAHERGDYSATEWAHPEIEYVIADGPSPGRWRGLAGMAGAVREFLNAWDECRVEADEYRELDDQRVLVLTHRGGRGKTSGLEVGQLRSRAADLFHVSDGKITKLVVYFDSDHALADLGLAPEGNAA
jgi:ketosteroid isomerase-like protein